MNKLSHTFSHLLFIAWILVSFTLPLYSQTTYTIDDPEELEDQSYLPGDIILLANGVYNSDERIDFVSNGTEDEPITFRAESPGGVKFTGGLQMNISGDYVVVDGFHWQGGYGASNFVQFRNGTDYANHSTIQNCVIDGLKIDPDDIADDLENNSITKHRWIVLYGTYNSVVNCSFMNKNSAGALILAEYEYNAEADPCATVGHIITNNYFYKYAKVDPSLSNAGDSETIRIGTSEYQNVNSNVLVANNYFVEADGENEIITNKSKGNTYINNTFRRCRGSLVLRHGSNATVDKNYFLGENVEGTGGIRITDSDHSITNNYIQDCVNVLSQSKWNNGITFIGGGDNADVACTSTNVSNGYQKSNNLFISNNSIINTNAPLFYNTDKGSTDPTGVVMDNLIYFDGNSTNLSEVISGDNASSYQDMGTALDYSGNVFVGTSLGVSNTGFDLDTSVTAIPDGEIFTFAGDGSIGKGAELGDYSPSEDANVGYGIGACFLDFQGNVISGGNCTIEIANLIAVGNLPTFTFAAQSSEVEVVSNVSWTATANDSWISLGSSEGEGNAIIDISVTQNEETTIRVGTVTFAQDDGEGEIETILTITQSGIDLTDIYNLINTGTGTPDDKVTVHSFSKEEVDGDTKFNYATNSLDKDHTTVWAADDGEILAGDYKGDGEYIIYDLGSEYYIDLIQFTTTDKDDPFGYQVWVSTTGTEESDFMKVLPDTEDLLLTLSNTTEFNQYLLSDVSARYVKLWGFGRFNAEGGTRTSVWSALGEVEFYGSDSVSSTDNKLESDVEIYPVPATDILNFKNIDRLNGISIYNMDCRVLLEKHLVDSEGDLSINISEFNNGSYIVLLIGDDVLEARMVYVLR